MIESVNGNGTDVLVNCFEINTSAERAVLTRHGPCFISVSAYLHRLSLFGRKERIGLLQSSDLNMKPRSLFLLSSCIASAVMVHAVATPFTNEEAPIDPDNMKCKLNTYFTALTSPVLTSLEGKCVFSRSKDQCEKGVALFQTLNPEEICVDGNFPTPLPPYLSTSRGFLGTGRGTS